MGQEGDGGVGVAVAGGGDEFGQVAGDVDAGVEEVGQDIDGAVSGGGGGVVEAGGDVWLVDDLDTALASAQSSPSSRFVTSAGEIVWPGAKITVGEAVSDTSSVLARKRRLNELRDEVETLVTSEGVEIAYNLFFI